MLPIEHEITKRERLHDTLVKSSNADPLAFATLSLQLGPANNAPPKTMIDAAFKFDRSGVSRLQRPPPRSRVKSAELIVVRAPSDTAIAAAHAAFNAEALLFVPVGSPPRAIKEIVRESADG